MGSILKGYVSAPRWPMCSVAEDDRRPGSAYAERSAFKRAYARKLLGRFGR